MGSKKSGRETQTVDSSDMGNVEDVFGKDGLVKPSEMSQELQEGGDDAQLDLDDMESFKEAIATDPEWKSHITVSLKAGQCIMGTFLGAGPDLELAPDPESGEVKSVKTHILQVKPRVTVMLLGSHQIDSRLEKFPVGDSIGIMHTGQISSGKRRVNQYRFFTKKQTVSTSPQLAAPATDAPVTPST